MKITEVKTYTVHMVRQNWLFVKVITDTGLYGWGEASVEGQVKATEACVHELAERWLMGQDPREIEKLWRKMYHGGFWKGGFIHMSAISGIDQALWDILGKSLNVPVYQLLGGKVRNGVRAYTHIRTKDPGEEAKYLCYDLGFAGVKTGSALNSPEELDELLNTIRTAVGQNKEIMIDNHGQETVASAKRRLQVASKYNLYFYEEPLPPENPAEYAMLRHETFGNPLAAGERTFSRFDARPLIEGQLIDYYQPDICHCGGISEIRRLATYAEIYHLKFAPHSPNGPVATAASIQVAAATQNFAILEFFSGMYAWKDLYDIDLTCKDGYFAISDRPGLGVELDESKFAQYPYEAIPTDVKYNEDGSVREV